jgi:hypothetical protein
MHKQNIEEKRGGEREREREEEEEKWQSRVLDWCHGWPEGQPTCLSWQGIRIRKEIRLDQINFLGIKSPLIHIRMGSYLLSIRQ